MADRLGQFSVFLAGARQIDSWAALRRKLGSPQSILCLGNGPSSEATAVSDASFDCLFRVNWLWRERGHTAPQIVFTADPDPPPEHCAPIICFPERQDANRILAGYSRRMRAPSQEYFIFAAMPSMLSGRGWTHRPTNGALMIGAATELRPNRLTIAGVDLYLHPAGKYPGSSGELNEYDAVHRREVDLDFIRAALDRFEGEVEILSEQLQASLMPR